MILVKVGGGTHLNIQGIVQDIKQLDQQVIFVHGASVQRDELAKKLGQSTKTITSPSGFTSVLTDQSALDILVMAYAGLVNKNWVSRFKAAGLQPIGLSGADADIWLGKRKQHLIAVEKGKQKLISDTHTGKVDSINTTLLNLLLKKKYLPVITQPAITPTGELINTDNDRNLAIMAGSLGIKQIIVLFEAPGLLTDITNPKSLVKHIKASELDNYLPYTKGTMKKKILGAKEAFKLGVTKIYWGDSRVDNPLQNALAGEGTTIS